MFLLNKISQRWSFGLIFLFCMSALAMALYAQYFQGAEPCPLCIAQRVIYAAIGLVAGIACLHTPKNWGTLIYVLILLAISAFGAKIAYHHIWLQSLPPEQWPASCGMPLEVLYKKIPLTGFLKLVLSGSSECASVEWRVLGISAPQLSLAGYLLIAVMTGYALLCSCRQTKIGSGY